MADLSIETEHTATGPAIRLAGELDSAAAQSVLECFERDAADAPGDWTIDLSALTFIDSAGLRAIILVQQRAEELGLSLSVVAPPLPLLELLDVTGMTERLSLQPEVAQGVRDERFSERIELELPREPSSPRHARSEVRRAIEDQCDEMELSTALLLTSELVTNAVIHPGPSAREPIRLRIITYPERVRVEIGDSGDGFDPSSLPVRPPEAGGRGLMVVARLATRWGTFRHEAPPEPRFTVWYELATGAAASSPVTDGKVG